MNTNYNKTLIFREVDGKQRPFIDINLVSETVGVPKDVLIYHILENSELVSLKDYINCGKAAAKHINIKTIIYLTQFFRKDISLWQKIIETMYESEEPTKVNYEDKYNKLCEDLKNLCINNSLVITENVDVLDDFDEDVDSDDSNKKSTYRKNSKLLPTLTEDETTWQKNAVEKARDKAKEQQSTLSAILRKVYSKMTNVYGIVLDQEKKDIRNMFNIDEDEHISSLYAVTVSAQLRSLFDCILADL